MKTRLYIFMISILALAASGCSHFDDMNRNPYALYDSEAQAQVQTILYNTEYALAGSTQALISELMQYTVNTDTEITSNMAYNYSIKESEAVRLWQRLYIQAGNAEHMLSKAREEENPTLVGVALALRAFLYTNIADVYGNVPYHDAGLLVFQKDSIDYVTEYDDMESIYKDVFLTLEEANTAFRSSDAKDFDPICDYMYDGSADKWQRFSNTLYLRLLMRVALKVEEQYGGVLQLNDTTALDVKAKIKTLWKCYQDGGGDYPVMRNTDDGAVVGFSTVDAALVTPFYTITEGTWTAQKTCRTLMKRMYDIKDAEAGAIHYTENGKDNYGYDPEFEDPRWKYYSTRRRGCPPQLTKDSLDVWMADSARVGRLPYTEGSKYNLRNCDHFALLNYSEVLFIFTEAALRGWITLTGDVKDMLYLPAIKASIMEWDKSISETSSAMTEFLDYQDRLYVEAGSGYAEQGFDNGMEARLCCVMWQKWVSAFFVGIESWCDYRRTGYPILKTDGPAAENDGILPTRMRYPADEAYRNMNSFSAAVSGWLGGSNNMKTDVWWADTQYSVRNREKGRN